VVVGGGATVVVVVVVVGRGVEVVVVVDVLVVVDGATVVGAGLRVVVVTTLCTTTFFFAGFAALGLVVPNAPSPPISKSTHAKARARSPNAVPAARALRRRIRALCSPCDTSTGTNRPRPGVLEPVIPA
jgi:hypothetical protein